MRSYLAILRVPGALAFCLTGLWARAGGSMMGIATVLMASTVYGSYTIAGALSATNSISWAIGAAVLAPLVDRFGQRRVMLPASLLSGALLLVVVGLAAGGAPAWSLFAPTALSGFTAGAPGALVRARWNHVLTDPHQLH
ncbi:MAG: MFS transporter, partial [Propionibacteriaceae bacterium]|nr:MFS transporter [Propionibacteriaceae bacterium]